MALDKVLPDEEILAGIHSNTLNKTIYHIYGQFAEVVIAYVVNNGGSQQDGDDVFQETVVAFIDLVTKHKFRGESSIKTFMVSIARNVWLNSLKKSKSLGHRAKVFETGRDQMDEDVIAPLYEREVKQQYLALMGKLGESCKTILTLFYYDSLSFKEIAVKMDLDNEQVARNKKYKCLKELTDMIRDNPVLAKSIKS
jgi:RNA polymerase sigma factor (sigma-70 family)